MSPYRPTARDAAIAAAPDLPRNLVRKIADAVVDAIEAKAAEDLERSAKQARLNVWHTWPEG